MQNARREDTTGSPIAGRGSGFDVDGFFPTQTFDIPRFTEREWTRLLHIKKKPKETQSQLRAIEYSLID